MGTTEQQYCLKWNNHNSTLLSVFDHLLEEESLVDCTLYAEGQYLKAHKIILSACSPYLRGMFNAVDPANPTNQIIHLVGIDFENLKSLVEYMYKGEANVPLHMLSSFIRAGESLKIKGLEVSATKQLEADGSTPNSQPTTVLPTPSSLASLTPTSMPSVSAATSLSHIFNGSKDATPSKKRSREAAQAAAAQAAAAQALANSALANSTLGGDAFGGGILAQRLASQPLLNITPEMLLARTSLANIPSQNPLQIPHPPPPMKKSRKSAEPKSTNANNLAFPLNFPLTGIPPQPLPLNFLPNMMQTPSNKSSRKKDKGASSGHGSAVTSTPVNNNNYESEGDEGVLKIDEEADAGKENRVGSISAASPASNKHAMIDDDIVDLEGESNGISTEDDEEEEPSMPGPGGAADMGHTQSGILNPWTGEPIHLSEDHDDNSAPDGFPQILDSSIRSLNTSGGSIGEIMPGATNGNTTNGNSNGGANEKDPAAKYACTRCGRSYLHQATLVRHQRYECGISASYPCPMCGRKFKRRDVLKGHMEKCANKSSQAQQAQQQAAAQAAVHAAMSSGNSTSPGLPILSGAASPLSGSSPLPMVPPPIINTVNTTISPFTPPPSSSSA